MSLIKVQLLSDPSAGWTPVADSIYIVKTAPAKVYIPVPSSQRMAYAYIPTNLQLLLSLSDDIYLSPDTASGIRPVKIEYNAFSAGGVGGPSIPLSSPFSVSMTDDLTGNVYALTLQDSFDTSDSIVSSVSVDEKSKCHKLRARIDLLNPSYVWTFNNRFVTNQGMHYVDEVSFARMEATDVDVAFPSAWGDAATRAMDIQKDAYATATLHHPSDVTFYTVGVSVGCTGDGTLLTIGRITLSVVSNNLVVTVDGIAYPTTTRITGTSTYNPATSPTVTAVSQCHWVMLAVDQNVIYVIIDDNLAITITLPTTTDSLLRAIDTIDIPASTTVRRQFNGLFVIPYFIPVDTLICNEMVEYNPDAKMVKSYGSTCTKYASKVTSIASPNGTESLKLQTNGQQGVVIFEIFATAGSQLTVTHVDLTGKTHVRWLTVAKDNSINVRYWLEEGDSLLLTTVKGSASARVLTIGEH